jgi:hypothetical protein
LLTRDYSLAFMDGTSRSQAPDEFPTEGGDHATLFFAHDVMDVDHWASKHSERVSAFAAWGTNVVDYVAADESSRVIVGVDVHNMDGMRASLASPEMDTLE